MGDMRRSSYSLGGGHRGWTPEPTLFVAHVGPRGSSNADRPAPHRQSLLSGDDGAQPGRLRTRGSFSRSASATKRITISSCSTHQTFTRWRSDAGTRVASWTHTSAFFGTERW